MNSIDRNYIPKLNIRETQEALVLINESLIKYLSEEIEFLEIRQPIISSKRVSTNISLINSQRQINFDASNDDIV
ncbi:MAG: hypothetical protein HRS50_01095 [Mycoplasmataceae bacterium]|nr:hypothetical protein [Mycoplasmataceae bacterium]